MGSHITVLDGKTITWMERDGQRFVAAIVDPESTAPARRVEPDGRVSRVLGEHQGLTYYGQPGEPASFEAATRATPEYSDLLLIGVTGGHGVTNQQQ